MIVEIEVDTLAQLDAVLAAGPDLVLLDNFTVDDLREAVVRRSAGPAVELEASGRHRPGDGSPCRHQRRGADQHRGA